MWYVIEAAQESQYEPMTPELNPLDEMTMLRYRAGLSYCGEHSELSKKTSPRLTSKRDIKP